jgi:hypothetical protein
VAAVERLSGDSTSTAKFFGSIWRWDETEGGGEGGGINLRESAERGRLQEHRGLVQRGSLSAQEEGDIDPPLPLHGIF